MRRSYMKFQGIWSHFRASNRRNTQIHHPLRDGNSNFSTCTRSIQKRAKFSDKSYYQFVTGGFLLGVAIPAVYMLDFHNERKITRAEMKTVAPKGSAPGHGLDRYFVANAVEIAAPAVANIRVNMKWAPSYAIQAGSGFVISEDGLVVTNAHVVASARPNDPILVTLTGGKKYQAQVHSTDVDTDIALLQVDTKGEKLPVAQIGKSRDLRAGEWVVALGSPQGLVNTVTVGIVSAVARLGSELGLLHSEYIQTDAAINSGNSGGPLVNLAGEVVGINSMKLAFSDGIGFAIPIDIAWEVVQQLMKFKRVRRPYVGISFHLIEVRQPQDQIFDRELGMLVDGVKAGSPAEKAGLLPGDIIVEIDGVKIRELGDVANKIGFTERTFEVKVLREGKRGFMKLNITSVKYDRRQ